MSVSSSNVPFVTPPGTPLEINMTERPLTCTNAIGTDTTEPHGTGVGTAGQKPTERPLTCTRNARNTHGTPHGTLPEPPSFRTGGSERNGERTNERPLTADGRDLCEEAFERIRADRTPSETPVSDDAHPEPEVRARPAEPDELTKTAAALLKLAVAQGWKTRADYARGSVEVRGKGLRLVESVVLRLQSPDGVRLVVIYEDRKPAGAWLGVVGIPGVMATNVTAVTAIVKNTWTGEITDEELTEALDEWEAA